jgi:4-hydroxymandelate oxidase
MDSFSSLEASARQRLGPEVYDFLAGGAGEELTLEDNLAAWSRLRLRPRVLRDVSAPDTATTVLGTSLALPVLVAPVGFQQLAHADAECATARAAAGAGSLMVISTRASRRLEDIAASAPHAPRWFQVYVLRDRGWTAELVERAVASGCAALMLTGDTPYVGRKRRDEANAFQLPAGVGMANLGSMVPGAADLDRETAAAQDPGVTFSDIAWLRDLGRVPVIVKGVLRADDALACLDAGAAAVAVSNHGGRQLDGALATADALPEIVAAVAGRGEVYVDGGIRRGSDVLKALALGARAVMVGRPVLWGLATGGAQGVTRVLADLRRELLEALALCGVSELGDLSPDLLTHSG